MENLVPFGVYRHYKGNCYEVVGFAKHSETLEDMVIYKALYGERGTWVRPLSMWENLIEVDGRTVKRFELLEEATADTTDNDLLDNLNKIHTTELGTARIRKNLGLGDADVVAWCKEQTENPDSITRTGKNWYVRGDGFVITVNANSYTIITAHRERAKNR